MRSIILMLALISPFAYAEKWFEKKNDLGGKIVLLTNKCNEKYPSLYMMFATSPSGKRINGCWAYFAGEVQVNYEDGSSYTYAPEIFNLIDDEKGRK